MPIQFLHRIMALSVILATLFMGSRALADNPLITHRFTADPNAFVYNGRVYIYCSADDYNQGGYDIQGYILISSDDLVNWTDHGEVFNVRQATNWANLAFAPGTIVRDDKIYLYFPDGGSSIGVAVADSPDGPFRDAIGRALVNRSTPGADVPWVFDPAGFLDDDGRAYLYFGGGESGNNSRVISLNNDLTSVTGTARALNAPEFFEASFMHKRNGIYYFSYSDDFSRDGAQIAYMMSSSPNSGFSYQGIILPSPPDNLGNNNHHSIFEFKGQTYIAYHSRTIANGDIYKRSVAIDRLTYRGDGTINRVNPTIAGVSQVKYGDPYSTVQAETIDRQSGIKTTRVGPGNVYLSSISNGDWTRFTGFDFGQGAESVEFRVASQSGGRIEIREGSASGRVAGICNVGPTGGSQSWTTVSCPVSGLEGIKNVVLRFTGNGSSIMHVDWYKFSEGLDDTPGVNDPPVARVSATPTRGAPPLTVAFDASGSRDPEGTALSFSWDFGDGDSGSGATPSHVYQNAGVYTATVSVSDGQLSTEASVAVVVDDTVFAVNAGGGAYVSADGTEYMADSGFSGGQTYSTSNAISGTSDDTLYQTERYGDHSYSVAVPNGDYLVTLHFAEIYHTSAGMRTFNVNIEGSNKISNLDIYSQVGANAAYVSESQVTVNDGRLDIQFITTLENAKISAIKVTKVN